MTALVGWENFFVIVGSSAGALIGLQFVVISLIADMPIARGQAQAGDAFATPTVVHFGAVLLLSAILSAPWHGFATAAVLWGLVGLSGIVYEIIVARRMRMQIVYTPEFEDWLFHVLLPFAAYATLAIYRHSRLATICATPCLALQRRRCCCSSSAFITPGMPSRTMSLSRKGDNRRPSAAPVSRSSTIASSSRGALPRSMRSTDSYSSAALRSPPSPSTCATTCRHDAERPHNLLRQGITAAAVRTSQ